MEALGRYRGAARGSTSATATSPPTCTAPTACGRARRCRRSPPRSPTAWGLGLRLLPVTDDRLQTRVTVAGEGEIGFQEYFVQRHHDVAVDRRALRRRRRRPRRRPACSRPSPRRRPGGDRPVEPDRVDRPGAGRPGVRDAVEARRADVVAVSPIVAGAALKGPADRLLRELGHEASVVGVARLYAPLVATLVIDEADADARRAPSRPRACAASWPPRSCTAPTEAAALAEVVLA